MEKYNSKNTTSAGESNSRDDTDEERISGPENESGKLSRVQQAEPDK